MTLPEWMAPVELIGFLTMIGAIMYNRVMTYRAIKEETAALKSAFHQYTVDFGKYITTCESCKLNVVKHHENSDIHVSMDLREQMKLMQDDIRDIKSILMRKA
jgi:hypothetical protein